MCDKRDNGKTGGGNEKGAETMILRWEGLRILHSLLKDPMLYLQIPKIHEKCE